MTKYFLAVFLLALACRAASAKELPWLKPKALRPGDTVAIVSPAAPAEMATVQKYAKLLEKAGYKVILPKDGGRKSGYLGGTDEQRAGEINEALRDPRVRAIMAARGGFGLTRILDKIDYQALRKDPKIITGYSDLTALHLAAARKARVITFHSPMPMRDLWNQDKRHAFAAASFRRAVFADQYPRGADGYEIAPPPGWAKPVKLAPGKANGRLVGGNLSLICATMGTPYALEGKGNILFLEDTNEAPYRIDRLLSQLRLAGVLDEVNGVVLGTFTSKTEKDAKEVERILAEYFGKAKVPVVRGFPVGHIPENATLPHGALVELDADKGTLRLVENPVSLAK